VEYNSLPKTNLINPEDGEQISNNTPTFKWNFTDLDSATQIGFQVLISENNLFEKIAFDSGEQASEIQSWEFPLETSYVELPDGIWYWKVRTKDSDGDWGSYSLPREVIISTYLPKSFINTPINFGFYNTMNEISGGATGNINGSIVTKVEILIEISNKDIYWNGIDWDSTTAWLLTTGTTNWSYNSSSVQWISGDRYRIQSRAFDNRNNTETPKPGIIFTFDSERPLSRINTPANNSIVTRLNTIEGNATDLTDSGVVIVEISIKENSTNNYWEGNKWTSNETWLSVLGTNSWSYDSRNISWNLGATYCIRSRATDKAGNIEIPGIGNRFQFGNQSKINYSINLSINDDAIYTNSTNVTLSLNLLNSIYEELKISFSLDKMTWTPWESFTTTKQFTLPEGDGEKIVYCKVLDNLNNSGKAYDTIILDITPPYALSILINDGLTITNSTNVTLKLYALDNTSGLDQMAFSTDGKTWGEWIDFSNLKLFTLPSGDGDKIIYFKVKDSAGNIGGPKLARIFLNTTDSLESELEHERESQNFEIHTVILISLVILIIIFFTILIILVSKRKRVNMKLSKEENEIISTIKKEIFKEQLTNPSGISKDKIKSKLEILHNDKEISDDTYQYITIVLNNGNFK